MINNEITTIKGKESAQKALEQAKNRVAVERKKANAEKRWNDYNLGERHMNHAICPLPSKIV
ncbi:hypothetical protein SAMN02745247_03003 [Butyrivibrio hungatei DSM 14810]|uniref:Uncharacterized protein n=1 Tax=Butyrivibrio hungatei DSM 14810 TaxID=1121132 RepID=A0A1M7T4X7_9FIRM|nr:hypothetical protein [Butyrivibrio hungatei]SHN65758.1 hypothetical protein SAMN02745247_03003 [Butyrivibrio hungatei DSM 14810]